MSFPKQYALPTFQPFVNGPARALRTDVTTAELRAIAATFHSAFFAEHADTEIFTQLVKLLLAKIYDERNTRNGADYKFQVLQKNGQEESASQVALRVHELYEKAKKNLVEADAADHLDAAIFPPQMVKSAVKALQSISVSGGAALNGDLVGAFFEQIMRVGFKQDKGMYFTHANLVWFMLEVLDLGGLTVQKWKHASVDADRLPRVIDPSSGSGAFLIRAMHMITAAALRASDELQDTEAERDFFEQCFPANKPNAWAKERLWGIDPKFTMAMTARVNMVLHGDGASRILRRDGLASFGPTFINATTSSSRSVPKSRYAPAVSEYFDAVVSNPPFGVSLSDSVKRNLGADFTLPTSASSEALFIERYAQLLRPNGRLGVVLPESVLNTAENRHVRELLFRFFHMRAIVSLPRNLFVETPTLVSLLFAQKKTAEEIEEWDAAYEGAAAAFDVAQKGALAAAAAVTRDAEAVYAKYTGLMSGYIPADSFVVTRGRNASVETLAASAGQTIGEAKAALRRFGSAAGFREMRANYILGVLADRFDMSWPTYEVNEVGYKLSKRGERRRPNQLLRFETESGREEPNLQLNSERAYVRVDVNNPERVLDFVRQEVTWR